jgi:DNA replication factor GINS
VDQFFQQLRKIQKKERSNGTLARVDETFYEDIHKYLDELRTHIGNDPFAAEQYLLKDTQRIATEICERREHKITDAAVVNIHRSYHLFAGKPQFDLIDTTPLNLTPEEEKFYFSLINTLTNHRKSISLEKLTSDEDDPSETKAPVKEAPKPQSNTLDDEVKSSPDKPQTTALDDEVKSSTTSNNEVKNSQDDDVVNRINEIANARVITDEKPEPIEKQIQKSANRVDDEISRLTRDKDEFVDLESRKIAKDSELVTMLVFDDVNSIVGVDEKVYGPFRPQDLVVLPKINAKIFVKNHKARFVKI